MDTSIKDTRAHLGELAHLSAKTEAAERRILDLAEKRLTALEGEMREARGGALTGDGDRYAQLVMERGQLQQVIARARSVLSPT